MTWLDRCCQTYEQNTVSIGNAERDRVVLLPVAHTTQQVHIEVVLKPDGSFVRADAVLPDKLTTVIPCTEESSARTSGAVPHPLVDKLQYIAGDYAAFGGKKKPCWDAYIEQLGKWCASPYAHPGVCAVLAYLQKACLIEDLVAAGVLFTDENGKLLAKWNGDKDATPLIFKTIAGGDQSEAFVRFAVTGADGTPKPLSSDPQVWESFTSYYESLLTTVDYCTVSGERTAVSALSPYKIRNAGDRAKLISCNDSSNFTYLGRFTDEREALSIGYRTTQKAHSALRWLIGRQGTQNGDQTVLVWGAKGEPVPDPCRDSFDLATSAPKSADDDWEDFGFDYAELADTPFTRESFALAFNKAIAGYRAKLSDAADVIVIVLDSATPGRLSIRYYRELQGSRMMSNIEDWHKHFAWQLEYRSVPKPGTTAKKPERQYITFWGAPAPADIAKAAYGDHVDGKLLQQTVERLLPCISEGRRFPRDIMLSAVHRATNGIGLESWDLRKTRSIACALIRGYYYRNCKEDYDMALNENSNDRNYLFGRILACAEQIERHAQSTAALGESDRRPTNAERLQTAFTMHPAKTTALLQEKLQPYLDRILAKTGHNSPRYELMLSLIDRLGEDSYSNAPLTELYLLGYASQKMQFRQENESYAKENKENKQNNV